jgi:hypothetical protein
MEEICQVNSEVLIHHGVAGVIKNADLKRLPVNAFIKSPRRFLEFQKGWYL